MGNESENDLDIKKDDELQIQETGSEDNKEAAAESDAASSIETSVPEAENNEAEQTETEQTETEQTESEQTESEQTENETENDASDNSNDEIEIISAETVPDDSDNNVLEPDNRKYHITGGDIVRYIILAISIGIFAFAAMRLIPRLISYKKESDNNKHIEEEVVSKGEEPITAAEGDFNGIIPSIVVDFDKLSEINSSSVGWIEIPVLGISYPIVQGEDNDYYLRHDINNNFAWSGAIYLDYRSNPELNEEHTTIYGHHMNDGTMFTSLLKYDNEDFFKKNQAANNNYVYIFTKESIKIYQIFSVVDSLFSDDPASFTVLIYSDEQKQQYLNHIKEKQLYDTGITATVDDTLLTLYTCQSDSSSEVRHMVHTKLVKEIKKN